MPGAGVAGVRRQSRAPWRSKAQRRAGAGPAAAGGQWGCRSGGGGGGGGEGGSGAGGGCVGGGGEASEKAAAEGSLREGGGAAAVMESRRWGADRRRRRPHGGACGREKRVWPVWGFSVNLYCAQRSNKISYEYEFEAHIMKRQGYLEILNGFEELMKQQIFWNVLSLYELFANGVNMDSNELSKNNWIPTKNIPDIMRKYKYTYKKKLINIEWIKIKTEFTC